MTTKSVSEEANTIIHCFWGDPRERNGAVSSKSSGSICPLTQQSHLQESTHKIHSEKYIKRLNLFIAALFVPAKDRKQVMCPSGRDWFSKRWHSHAMELYAAVKEGRSSPRIAASDL